jgi:hypothetical protein
MSAYVFLGPTLALPDARAILDAVYLPPARQGDVYRLVSLRRPRIIALVDGYFNQVPAVWHKEILWALSTGVQVFGASSMGALRAAELAPFGMRGVGRIFEAYRDGVLAPYQAEAFEDDDEVAVRHGPGELGYASLSEAMVNIRCTLAAAAVAGVISDATRDSMVRLAKREFYPHRRYERVLEQARRLDLPDEELSTFQLWLPEGRCDQKRDDALSLLATVRDHLRTDTPCDEVSFDFQHTVQWQAATDAVMADRRREPGVLDELRLEGAAYFTARRKVLNGLLAVTGRTDGLESADALRHELALPALEQIDAVLTAHHNQPDHLDCLWHRELEVRELESGLEALPETLIERHLLSELRETGEYARLHARFQRKQTLLSTLATVPSETALTGLQELQLQDWYFGRCLGKAIPEDLGIYVEALGFGDVGAFNRALLHEYVYLENAQ